MSLKDVKLIAIDIEGPRGYRTQREIEASWEAYNNRKTGWTRQELRARLLSRIPSGIFSVVVSVVVGAGFGVYVAGIDYLHGLKYHVSSTPATDLRMITIAFGVLGSVLLLVGEYLDATSTEELRMLPPDTGPSAEAVHALHAAYGRRQRSQGKGRCPR